MRRGAGIFCGIALQDAGLIEQGTQEAYRTARNVTPDRLATGGRPDRESPSRRALSNGCHVGT